MSKRIKERSTRKPLGDVSNNVKLSRTGKNTMKDDDDSVLDRLLIARSTLSGVIGQVDELIAQAFELKQTKNVGVHEIESFMHTLSDIQESLKPWVKKLQASFSPPSPKPINLSKQSLPRKESSTVKKEKKCHISNNPEKGTMSLISPSPLVSWHAGCRVESCRQLFLLTPLPKSKMLPPSLPILSESMPEKMIPNKKGSKGTFAEQIEATPTPQMESSVQTMFATPLKFTNQKTMDRETYLLTPCWKMSPPKTCRLLEPIQESTLSASIIQSSNESCSNDIQVSEGWISNYPELFTLQEKSRKRNEIETSLDWFLSPPKTCVLLEPPDEKCLADQDSDPLSSKRCIDANPKSEQKKSHRYQSLHQRTPNNGKFVTSVEVIEQTPICQGLDSANHRAPRNPGENTLKRELWSKFEAISTDDNSLIFDVSVLGRTMKTRGFLDRLEEASLEEMNSDIKSSG